MEIVQYYISEPGFAAAGEASERDGRGQLRNDR
jgi:hypothetical protein